MGRTVGGCRSMKGSGGLMYVYDREPRERGLKLKDVRI